MRIALVASNSPNSFFELEEGSFLIGRWDPDSGSFPEIDLEAHDKDNKVSRKHAVLEIRQGIATIEDLGSLNGTYTKEGERLEIGVPLVLKDQSEFIVGNIIIRFEA